MTRDSYQVGIICALDIEFDAILAMLDEEHPSLDKVAGDGNIYSFGRIHQHHVVIACASAGTAGSATLVAKDMIRSFKIKAAFLVGLCDGVWSEERDVRLGDVIVSQPTMHHGGVVQWDFNYHWLKHGGFRHTGMLNRPPDTLFEALRRLKAQHPRHGLDYTQSLTELLRRHPEWMSISADRCTDMLFSWDYRHVAGRNCANCDPSRIVTRKHTRDTTSPRIHYGNIASSIGVPLEALERDSIAEQQGVICFETEAAGLMSTFPCIMIKGVCSYGDSHKNESWYPYAAGAAACYVKDLIRAIGGGPNVSSGYLDLNYSRHETRFLQIHGSGESDQIACTIYAGSPLENDDYVALSYCWGDHSSTDYVIVNRMLRQVTTSLKTALSELRRRSIATAWIDALCIDQNNPNEKTYQLSQMDSIYSRASKVIVWLGPAADNSGLAMRYLKQKGRFHSHYVAYEARVAIATLLKRPYWRRAWIIQEVAKASKVEVWCGSQMASWDYFVPYLNGPSFGSDSLPLRILRRFCDAEQASQKEVPRMLLSTAMVHTMYTRASYSRDKIYALIGLTRDGRTIIPFPNYEQPDDQVFDDILRHIITVQGRLDFLFFAGRRKKDHCTPSWLPSWHQTLKLRLSELPICRWMDPLSIERLEPSGGDCVTWNQESDALNVDAQIIGTIRGGLERPVTVQHGYEQKWLEQHVSAIKSENSRLRLDLPHLATVLVVCRRLCACSSPDLDLLNYTWFENDQIPALLDILGGQQPSSTQRQGRDYRTLNAWFNSQGSVSYQGVSLQDVVRHWASRKWKHNYSDPHIPAGQYNLLHRLEAGIRKTRAHGMELMAGTEKLPLIVAHPDTKAGDCIVWLRQTSLLAILRPGAEGRFSVVGEIADTPERLGLCGHRSCVSGGLLSHGDTVHSASYKIKYVHPTAQPSP